MIVLGVVVLEELVDEPFGPPPQGGTPGSVGLDGSLDDADVAGAVGTQLGVDLEVEADVCCGFHG